MSDLYENSLFGINGELFITNWVGSLPSTPGNILYAKSGNLITLGFPSIEAVSTSSNPITSSLNLPSEIRPGQNVLFPLMVIVSGTQQFGHATIDFGGQINIHPDGNAGSVFLNGQSNGFGNNVITYLGSGAF